MEGVRAIHDVLSAGGYVEELFVAEGADIARLLDPAVDDPPDLHLVTRSVLEAITDSVTPQGAVAVARSPLRNLEEVRARHGLILILVGVSDPGNVGTMIRTAAAAAVDAVVLTTGSCDPLNPKTARAATSALFDVPLVADVSFEEAAAVVSGLGFTTVGTAGSAPTTIYEADLTRRLAIVLGNEAHGLAVEHRDALDEIISIPMPGAIESLNVATAGALVLFEALRQRRLSSDESEEGS